MNFALNDDQRMMKTLIERFAADCYAPGQRAIHRAGPAGYSADNWALLADTGVLALPFSGEDGGLDGGLVEIITVMEEVGRGLVIEPILAEILIAGRVLAAAGTAAQRAAWLAPLIDGSRHLGMAFAEHGSGWLLDVPETRMTPNGLVGSKTFAPAAADAYIVTALARDRVELFLIDATAPGLARRDYRLIDGSVASELRLDGVVAEPLERGLDGITEVLDEARLAVCAEMVGIAGALFETTLDYVRQRRQFGAAIGSFQAIQHRLADLYTAMEQGRSHLYRAALSVPGERSATVAAAKAYITAACVHLGEECIQFHGGMGVSDDLDIGHGHKRLLLLATMFGDADHEIARYNAALRAA